MTQVRHRYDKEERIDTEIRILHSKFINSVHIKTFSPDHIKKSLTWLKQYDTDYRVFHAQLHKYELDPPIAESVVQTFEQAHDITLPKDYKTFITRVANSGAGPESGLFPVIDSTTGALIEKPSGYRFDLSKPFMLNRRWDPDIYHAPEQEDELWNDEYDDDRWIQGTILINHSGCGNYTLLVVRGPEAGSIWYDCRNSYGGLIPSFQPDNRNKRLSFSQWYGAWLQKSVDQIQAHKRPSQEDTS